MENCIKCEKKTFKDDLCFIHYHLKLVSKQETQKKGFKKKKNIENIIKRNKSAISRLVENNKKDIENMHQLDPKFNHLKQIEQILGDAFVKLQELK